MFEGPRAAKLGELSKIISLVSEIFLAPRGLPPIINELFPLLFNANNLENLRVIVKDGQPISHVGIWEGKLLIYGSWFNIGMIGAVCTHKDFRGRGYASALVMDALNKMKMDGVDFILISGDRNLYRRFGCFKSGIVYRYNISYTIPCDMLKTLKNKFRTIHYNKDLIRDVIAIYQKEPVRYRRSFEEFKLLLEVLTKQPENLKSRVYLAALDDKPLAYIAVSLFPGMKNLRVWEYAGLRSAVLYLILCALETERGNSIEITVPFHDIEMLSLLEKCGLNRPPANSEANMLILNPKLFFEKAKHYLTERADEKDILKIDLEEINEKVKVSLNNETRILEPEDFTLLFFDSPEKNRPREKIEPIRKLLDDSLPMPTPIYGLNYT